MPRATATRLSRRSCKGAGWHKRGYREDGNLFIQLKRGTYGFSRTHEVNENETIANFVQGMLADLSSEDGWCSIPEGWEVVFTGKRQTLDYDSEALVKSIFDGGEVVTAKIFDDEGNQRIATGGYDPVTGARITFGYHEPGNKEAYNP